MDSWLNLEQRFRLLAPELRHHRLDAQWGAADEYWRLTGARDTPATEQFEILSSLAGQLLGRVLKGGNETEKLLLSLHDTKLRWYNALKAMSSSFGRHSYAEQRNEDGSSAGLIFTGTVSQIAEASANLCLALHISHPIVERKTKWQWFHENYLRALIVAIVAAIATAAIKMLLA